ncbi:hypothetical protein [Kribbella sp. NPDC004875]|uniref:hypothetical protein n=1 Tax=Kribbella sp. NPDC004875 TaxID=3364107 RepID=UPI00368584DA
MRIGAAVVAGVALVAAPVGSAYAAPTATGASQPYVHLLSGKGFSTGGAYVSQGEDIKLTLSTLPKNTQVLVEECDSGHDLGDVKVFTAKAKAQTLATEVPKGTCFVMLLAPKGGNGGYVVGGTLSY